MLRGGSAAAPALTTHAHHLRIVIISDFWLPIEILATMCRFTLLLGITFLTTTMLMVDSAKQQVQLSDSYLPVAMQVIAHLTDQMAFEAKDEQTKPQADPTIKPTSKPPSWTKPTNKPSTKPPYLWTRPPSSGTKPPSIWVQPVKTTMKPYVVADEARPSNGGWWMSYGLLSRQVTTPFHAPGLFAPVAPPKPSDRTRITQQDFILLPLHRNTQYTVIEPQEKITEEPLLSIHEEEVKPLMEPAKDPALLPPHFDAIDKASRSDLQEEPEDNLQYLSQNVREMINMANDPDDERIVDVWEGIRGLQNQEKMPKAKLSSSNLRLLLLYDLLSREAKRLRLSDYSGFSPDVMRTLQDSWSGGARAQLSLALSKMVERRDCEHEYANNRAKEMVVELANDQSKLSDELRYLQPLVYRN